MLVAGVIAGCTPEPTPQSSPTLLFSTEQEAFAAAEATYRAYNQATNAYLSDHEAADPFGFTVGTAHEELLETTQYLQREKLSIEGRSSIASFSKLSVALDQEPVSVSAMACTDVSATRIVNEVGVDVTPADRFDIAPLKVTLVLLPEGFRVSDSVLASEYQC